MTQHGYSLVDAPAPGMRRGDGKTAIVRAEPTDLTPADLDARAIIPYLDGAHRPLVDAFRELRTRLLATSSDNFVTLVAPVGTGCGGSFVARNLAVALTFDPARSAVLVDCNLRQPTQHVALKVDDAHAGLCEYLEDSEAAVETVVHDTALPRLKLIPAGRSRYRGMETEHFASVRMRLLVDSLRAGHADRYVFLDGPPVLGAPDARMLSELADVVVLVAGYGHHTPAHIAAAAGNFDPARFAGVVFNEGA
ncbi:hypothetical protein GCM10028862_00060 [Luteimonas pelagia]